MKDFTREYILQPICEEEDDEGISRNKCFLVVTRNSVLMMMDLKYSQG